MCSSRRRHMIDDINMSHFLRRGLRFLLWTKKRTSTPPALGEDVSATHLESANQFEVENVGDFSTKSPLTPFYEQRGRIVLVPAEGSLAITRRGEGERGGGPSRHLDLFSRRQRRSEERIRLAKSDDRREEHEGKVDRAHSTRRKVKKMLAEREHFHFTRAKVNRFVA